MWRKYWATLCGVVLFLSAFPAVAQDGEIVLPGIVVTASPLETTEDQSFVAVTVLDEEDIESGHSRSLGDLLFSQPGISSSTYAAGASRPIIRGLDNFRVGITENGIGVHDVSALSEDHGVPIDPLSAKKVEVIRGPATLRYGSQAIGGVVNVTNDRIPSSIPGGRYQKLEIEGAYSSVDEGGEGSIQLGAGSGNFAFHADAYKRRGSDYETPEGVQEGTSFSSEGGALGASLVFKDGYIGVSYSRFSSLYYIPGEEAVESNLHIDMDQSKISSKGELRLRDSFISKVKYWFGYTNYKHKEIGSGHHHEDDHDDDHDDHDEHGHDDDEDEHEDELEVAAIFKNKQYEARTEVLHNPFSTFLGSMKGAVGVQYGYRDLSILGEHADLLEPNKTTSVAAYIFEEVQATKNLKLQFAGRIEQVDIDGAGIDFDGDFEFEETPEAEKMSRKFVPYSLSAGVLYQFNHGIVGRLNGQYVERTPDALELFAKGVHEATETFEIGDPNLDKEKAHTVELGLKKSKGRFRFDGSAYYTKFSGYIFKNFTGNTCSEEGDCEAHHDDDDDHEEHGHGLAQIAYDQKDATFYGVELSASYDVAKVASGMFGIDGQYDYVRSKFDDGTNVPRITPQRLGFGLYYRSSDIFARIGALHAFDQDDIADGQETATEGYTLVNAELNYTMKFGETDGLFPEMTIGLKGENLLDEDVRNHVSFKKDEVLQPGRNIMLRGKIKLN